MFTGSSHRWWELNCAFRCRQQFLHIPSNCDDEVREIPNCQRDEASLRVPSLWRELRHGVAADGAPLPPHWVHAEAGDDRVERRCHCREAVRLHVVLHAVRLYRGVDGAPRTSWRSATTRVPLWSSACVGRQTGGTQSHSCQEDSRSSSTDR